MPGAQTRLYVILARAARAGAVFRRGPSKQVQLARWRLDDDEFELGQWFKGRIYERRCDLSPSGRLLVYFAASQKPPYGSWTAVSRPPYLTALALWPKGDAWGGGGLFETENKLLLNHQSSMTALAPGFALPPRLRVEPFGGFSGRGEDGPIEHTRLQRDGWTLIDAGSGTKPNWKASLVWKYDSPVIYEKTSTARGRALALSSILKGIHQRGGPWRVVDHEVRDDGEVVRALPGADWADWDANGDLLHAQGGSLFRSERKGNGRLAEPRLLFDFAPLKFSPLKAPDDALSW